MKTIVTISREFGAAGGEIGRRVAAELGYEYYDKEIIFRAASESNIDIERMLQWDEKVPANFSFAQSLFDFYNKPLNEKMYEAQKHVIRQIGEKGNCVIVGRNSDQILKEYDHSLHVFVSAELYFRVNHLKSLLPEESEERIKERMHNVDRRRKKFSKYYTGCEFGYAPNYDLCLRSSRLGIDGCVNVILDMVKTGR